MNSDLDLVGRTSNALERLGVGATDSLLVAVSGGVDSMTLAFVLVQLHHAGKIGSIAIAHVDHALREESKMDEEHVRGFAERHGLSYHTIRADTQAEAELRKKGIEETAREIRYEFLEECSKKLKVYWVLTAHTANDRAETVLMNMMRGAGVRGLAGIPETRMIGNIKLIRPWLSVSRSEIEAYASANEIAFRHDASNDTMLYTRNRVRHLVIPALEEAFPHRDPIRAISRLAEHMSELDQLMQVYTEEKLDASISGNGLSLATLRELKGLPLKMLLETWLARQDRYVQMTADDLERIELFVAEEAERIQMRGDLRLVKNRDVLEIENSEDMSFNAVLLLADTEVVTPYGKIRMTIREGNSYTSDPTSAFFDADKLDPGSLVVRPWESGDRIEPFGMQGRTKLISDALNEAGILGQRKRFYPVVAIADQIIWIPGIRASQFARIGPDTRRVLRLEFIA